MYAFILSLSPLFSDEPGERQVRVAVERAPVYAEANSLSYRIETLKKGTVLSVFEMGSTNPEWFYVRYRSARWRSVVTGFIQASMVEEITEKPAEEPKEEPIVQKPAEAPKKPVEKKEEPEEKPLEISVEEVLLASSLLPNKLFPLPKIAEEEKEPRIFMYIETRPAQEKAEVSRREDQAEDVLPKIEKPAAKQKEAEPAIEQVELKVEEFVDVSSLPSPISYILPQAESRFEPKTFISVETKPAITESQKQEEAVKDIIKEIPEKLEERRPPEKELTQPETTQSEPVEKKKPVQKEEEPAKTPKPEEKQVVPQIRRDRPPQSKKPKFPGDWSFLTLGAGYGPSQGSGFGGILQLNTKMGFSIHIGAGYYPTSYYYSEYDWAKDRVLYNIGVKYYLPFGKNNFRPYLDIQYGGISVEAVRVVTGIWYYQYVYKNIQKTLLGPSLLAGIELKLGTFGLHGALGLSYTQMDWDYWERNYFLTADVGLLLYLW